MAEEQKKERKSLGLLVPNIKKENPKSYDLKGTLKLPEELGGKNIRVGCYKALASGEGKMAKDEPYYWVHRLEELEVNSDNTTFDPASLET
jgi:ABC-type proline/glycine betaine transport system ATPase subunit